MVLEKRSCVIPLGFNRITLTVVLRVDDKSSQAEVKDQLGDYCNVDKKRKMLTASTNIVAVEVVRSGCILGMSGRIVDKNYRWT
jgi:hypothetical protein